MPLALCVLMAVGTLQGQAIGYPETYRELRLPELPDATLTSAGRTANLKDGIGLRLNSTKTLNDIKEFYRAALVALGYADAATPGQRARGSFSAAGLTFRKGAITYRMFMSQVGPQVQITISVIEK